MAESEAPAASTESASEKNEDGTSEESALLNSSSSKSSSSSKGVSFKLPEGHTDERKSLSQSQRSGSLADMSSFLESFKEFQKAVSGVLDTKEGTEAVKKKSSKHVKWSSRHTLDKSFSRTKLDRPPKYIEEPGLPRTKRLERTRLSKRLQSMEFPQDACFQALKMSNDDVSNAMSRLLRWFPKGQGGKTMCSQLLDQIIRAEKKLSELRQKMKDTFATGSIVTQLRMLYTAYKDHDDSDKNYLTPAEFGSLTHSLGVDLSSSELHEIIEKLDENQDGEIQFEEFLSWWDKSEVTKLYEANKDDLEDLFDRAKKPIKRYSSTIFNEDGTPVSAFPMPGSIRKKRSKKFLDKVDRKPDFRGRRHTYGYELGKKKLKNCASATRISDMISKFDMYKKDSPRTLPTLDVEAEKKKKKRSKHSQSAPALV